MRQVHKAGEKCFVDYSGNKLTIVDRVTGARVEVELFVAVLGASNYTYAEATATQRSADWIASHVRLIEFLGGAPGAFVPDPDQLKSGVVVASRLDRPELTALPRDRFIHGDWSRATVKLDYHVNVDHHDYSVPYQRATDEVWIRLAAATVEVFYKSKRCVQCGRRRIQDWRRRSGSCRTLVLAVPRPDLASVRSAAFVLSHAS